MANGQTADCGSSPRMRGADHQQDLLLLHRRIIPAHAGSSKAVYQSHKLVEDHPRACGEQFSVICILSIRRWIIPAHAGSRLHYNEAEDAY